MTIVVEFDTLLISHLRGVHHVIMPTIDYHMAISLRCAYYYRLRGAHDNITLLSYIQSTVLYFSQYISSNQKATKFVPQGPDSFIAAALQKLS